MLLRSYPSCRNPKSYQSRQLQKSVGALSRVRPDPIVCQNNVYRDENMSLSRRINGNRGLETAPTDDAATSAIASILFPSPFPAATLAAVLPTISGRTRSDGDQGRGNHEGGMARGCELHQARGKPTLRRPLTPAPRLTFSPSSANSAGSRHVQAKRRSKATLEPEAGR
jgi:hypothetical protein